MCVCGVPQKYAIFVAQLVRPHNNIPLITSFLLLLTVVICNCYAMVDNFIVAVVEVLKILVATIVSNFTTTKINLASW
jgi:hypothetical protein